MLILPAQLESYRSLKDRSVKIVFETGELTPDQAAGINQTLQKFGYLAFKDNPFKEQEKEVIGNLEADFEDKGKTPGQRLRGVLYRNWEQDNKGFETFATYYPHMMEKIINHYKSKLDD